MTNRTQNNRRTSTNKPKAFSQSYKPTVEFRHPNSITEEKQNYYSQTNPKAKTVSQNKNKPKAKTVYQNKNKTKTKTKSTYTKSSYNKNQKINKRSANKVQPSINTKNKVKQTNVSAIIIFSIVIAISLIIIITAIMFRTNLFGIMA